MEEVKVKEIGIKKINIIQNEDVYDIKVEKNHNFFANKLLIHNCGEQPLPIGGVCLLGAINLTQYIDVESRDWDYKKLEKDIPVIVRLMDNVNDITYVPLKIQEENLQNKRRVGLGIMGYGSALMMMRVPYGGSKALKMTDELMQFLANHAYSHSALLAKEKGAFPLFEKEKYLEGNFIKKLSHSTRALITENGIRNSHLLTIAPTGNTSTLANIVSGGLEPVFSPVYIRTVIVPFTPEGLIVPKTIDWINRQILDEPLQNWEWVKEGDESLLRTEYKGIIYKIDKNRGLVREETVKDYAVRFLEEKKLWNPNAEWVCTVNSLKIDEHINTMKVFANYIDSAMSKTVNIPNDYSFEDFKNTYMKTYETGFIKGITTYRANTMASVLSEVKKDTSSSTVEERIIKNTAPHRPKKLECDIHHIKAIGNEWTVIVGLLDKDPYEVFAFKKTKVKIPTKVTKGALIKLKSGYYNLDCDGFEFEDIGNLFEQDEQEALTRMISTALRHGADIKHVVEQLNKSEGTVVSFAKAIARTLKKYLADDTILQGKPCEYCGCKEYIKIEGCYKCKNCLQGGCG